MKIGMIPYGSGDEWETNGNPHLMRIVESLNKLGWEVFGLVSDDFKTPNRLAEKGIDIILIHWPSCVFDVDGFSAHTLLGKCVLEIQSRVPRDLNSVYYRLHKIIHELSLQTVNWLHNLYINYSAEQICNSIIKNITASRLPVIWEIHDLGSHHISNRLSMAEVEHKFLWKLYQVCSGIVIHESSCVEPVTQKYGSCRPYVVAELGTYFYGKPVDKGEARQRLGIASSGKVFAYIGTARPNRNPLNAIISFGRVAGSEDKLVVASTGLGPYIPQELFDSRITVINRYLFPEELRDVFCSADFVINDGEQYLTSAVVRTAMGYGVPVIAYPYGATLDMAKNAALFIGDGGLDEIIYEALHIDQIRYEVLCQEALNRNAERSWEMTGIKLDKFLRSFVSF